MTSELDSHVNRVATLDFSVPSLGEPTLPSPLPASTHVSELARVGYYSDPEIIRGLLNEGKPVPAFEAAGPRARLFHDPTWTRVGIVTCGGLCPGINHVIKNLVTTLHQVYDVDNVFGIQYGYRGLNPEFKLEPVPLSPDNVDTIHEDGGSILGSSRGAQDTQQMLRSLDRLSINVLFTIGGDGTLHGAALLAQAAMERKLGISIIGIPKTIDNDIDFTEKTFGFETAVQASTSIITVAHMEAKGSYNGISIVKLMGRDSGFIAASAALANPVVNICLVPEVPFALEGEGGLLPALISRLERKQHMVIVVAEGAGQELFQGLPEQRDVSGNVLKYDIGIYLRDRIHAYLTEHKIEHALKYFDPSYLIRGIPAQGTDAIFCLHLAENAVHAAMAGKTNMLVGFWHNRFTHVPIPLAVNLRRKIDPASQLWQSVLNTTQQQRILHTVQG